MCESTSELLFKFNFEAFNRAYKSGDKIGSEALALVGKL